MIIGATQGTDLTYFASYYGDWIYGLAALEGSGIADLADLKGKRIGVTTVASSGTTFARTALRSAGVDPDDVTFVPIGVGAQQITAIKAGNVDALALWDTQYQIVKNAGIGLEDLAVPGMGDMYGGGFAASKSQLEKDPDKFVKFGRAFAKGVVLAESDPEAAIKAMWKEQPDTAAGPGAGGLDEQVRVLQVRLDGLGVPEGKQEWGLIDMTRVQHAIDFAEKSALIKEPVKAESIVDTGLLDEINDFSRDEVVGQAGKQ